MSKMNSLTIIALIFIPLSSGIGGILLAMGQARSSSKDKDEIVSSARIDNSNLRREIIELKDERTALKKDLSDRDDILQKRNAKIEDLSIKLAERSEYIQNYLTGGNGYPFIDVHTTRNANNEEVAGVFFITTISEFPTYSLDINAFDFDKLEKAAKKVSHSQNLVLSLGDWNASKLFSIKVDELAPNQSRFLDNYQFPLREARFLIQLQARNNSFVEKIVAVQLGNVLHFAHQLFTWKGDLLKEELSDSNDPAIKKILFERLESIPAQFKYDLSQ